jgi:hypothetical protein
MRSRDQLALGAAACLLMSIAAGLVPDSLASPYYRTAGWLLFALMALVLIYLAFPHMWVYSLWLAGIYGTSVFGLMLMLLGGERIFARYWAAVGIGALMELLALFLVYTLLMRIRIARSVLDSRAPLGIWFMVVILFFVFSNLSGLGLAAWFSTQSMAGLGAYAGFEVVLVLSAVYICRAPEDAIWSVAPAAPAEPSAVPEGQAAHLLKMITPRKQTPAPKVCPACGAPLKSVGLACPSCGARTEVSWCASSESYVVPCHSCGAYTLSVEKRCIRCRAPLDRKSVV